MNVVPVGFVDNDAVGHFHDSPFDALKLVSGSGNLYQQEKVDHRVYGCFALAYTDRLDEDDVEAGCFTKDHGFAGFPGDTT